MRGVGLGIKAGLGAFKAGDMKQIGGEYDPGFVFCLFVLLRLLGCCPGDRFVISVLRVYFVFLYLLMFA